MEQFRRVWQSIMSTLGQMTISQRLLIGSLAVIGVMVLFLVTQYAATPRMVDLYAGGAGGDQQQTARILQASGIPTSVVNGNIMVPPGRQSEAIAALAQAGQLPGDTTLLFRNLIDAQGMHLSKQQNDQLYAIALQNELARVISGFPGIREAAVMLDVPDARGLGRAVRTPTASATVFTNNGQSIDQGTVDAVAELIAGARAGLTVQNVRVIDGSTRRQRRPTNPDEVLPTTYLEHAAAIESQVREKIDDLLGYIPGRTIAVTAQVDVTRVSSEVLRHFEPQQGTVSLPLSENAKSIQTAARTRGNEPGTRANVQADLSAGAGGGGSGTEQTEDEISFENHVGHKIDRISDPRGMPTRLAASINIPRSYISGLLGVAEGDPAPTDAQIDARFEIERAKIESSVLPHVKTNDENGAITGDVVVSMIPIDVPMITGDLQQAGLLAGGGPLGSILGGDMLDKIILAVLAASSMGMMFMMVRKAGRREAMPTPAEVVGIPPQLASPEDLIGEADESDLAIDGIEVDDSSVRASKMLEQIQAMITEQPSSAARLVNRWMTTVDES
jgi:flagellar biosynthesis/type III secretory pathway M-ring protein FliF/YscJ